MAGMTAGTPTEKSKFILKWKHGISDDADTSVKEDPSLAAQRLVNLYRCFKIMTPAEQQNFLAELKNTPDGIRGLLLKLTGGREVEAFYRFMKEGNITPLAVSQKEEEIAAAKKAASTPPPPPSFYS